MAEHAYAAGLEAGFAAYERGEHEGAIKLWLPLARRGHAEAQYNLAVVYADGSSLQRDLVKAAVWFRRAAVQGDAEAQFDLGVMYGTISAPDIVNAYVWMRLAASGGHQDAVTAVSGIYIRLTPQQLREADFMAKEWRFQIAIKNSDD